MKKSNQTIMICIVRLLFLIFSVFCFTGCTGGGNPAIEKEVYKFFINKMRVQFDTEIIERDNGIYLPLMDMVKKLGLNGQFLMDGDKLAIGFSLKKSDNNEHGIFVSSDAREAFVDDIQIVMDFPAINQNDDVYIYYTFLENIFDADCAFNKNNRTVEVINTEYLTCPKAFQRNNINPCSFYEIKDPQLRPDNTFTDLISGFGRYKALGWGFAADDIEGNLEFARYKAQSGYSRISSTINTKDFGWVTWDDSEIDISEENDYLYTAFKENGLKIIYNLIFWDKEYHKNGGEIEIPRFQTQESIDRYLDFVDRMTKHFKGRVDYYNLWNEPNVGDSIQWVTPEKYIEVAKRAIPIIRRNDPAVKIIIGAATGYNNPDSQEYTDMFVNSDLACQADVIDIHPMYGVSPESLSEYYYNYDNLLNELKNEAFENGFRGEFLSNEMGWGYTSAATEVIGGHDMLYDSMNVVNKYLIRGVTINRGLGFSTGIGSGTIDEITMKRMGSLFAGLEPEAFDIDINTTIDKIRHYEFLSYTGEKIISVWDDNAALDENKIGILSDIVIKDFSAEKITAVDLLHGITCEINFEMVGGSTFIPALYISDNPVFLIFE